MTIQKYGDTDIETACVYYEYGNALFRAASAKKMSPPEVNNDEDSKPKAHSDNGNLSKEDADENDIDDFELALEQMENAFAIIYEYMSNFNSKDNSNISSDRSANIYLEWVNDQIPRILTGIGDLFVSSDRFAEGVDAYTRAIPYREAEVKRSKDSNSEDKDSLLERLRQSRLLCESNVLVSETLLQCPVDKDVSVTDGDTGSIRVLVSASERTDFARGYYDKARDELQNAVFLMGKIAQSSSDGLASLGKEKEDICYLATILMGVGTTLADIDAEHDEKNSLASVKKARIE